MRKQQAEAGDIVLLYGDESEALTHPYLARAWAKVGADLRVPAPGQAKKVAMLGSLDHVTRQLIVHTSNLSMTALAARAHWLTVEWLPKYAPELNDIEVVWHDLKAHHLAHQTFADTDALDRAIRQAVDELNAERMVVPLADSRMVVMRARPLVRG